MGVYKGFEPPSPPLGGGPSIGHAPYLKCRVPRLGSHATVLTFFCCKIHICGRATFSVNEISFSSLCVKGLRQMLHSRAEVSYQGFDHFL